MTAGQRILVVEDDKDLADLLADDPGDTGYSVRTAANAEAGHAELKRQSPELVLCDLCLPEMSGLDFLRQVTALPELPAFILITAFGTIPQAVEALKAGADDFLTKPLDLEHLHVRVVRTLEPHRLRREIASYRRSGSDAHFHGLVGQSPSMQQLYDQISTLAQAGGSVLIEGESGSSKELVARAIHAESPRAEGAFVVVNCASIPAELMESELFGHKAGAFTGATGSRRGLFGQADGGTLFLDEIAEMPAVLQATLLRVVQEGYVRSVGSEREVSIDVRVVVATNRDLREEVACGRFRTDLFYRLETFTLRMPPLRERGEDLELLTGRFIAQFAQQLNRGEVRLTEKALGCLQRYLFPGNVRELRNAMERPSPLPETDGFNRPICLSACAEPNQRALPPNQAPSLQNFWKTGC